MKVRDYETELLEIEKAYNDEQALIKQCTEKLFEDIKEPMDFFIRKEFVTGNEYTNLYKAYNFAISEVTDFKGDAIVKLLEYSTTFYVNGVDYINWCAQNKINFGELEVMILNFLNKKYTIGSETSWSKLFMGYEAKISKKDLKEEVSQKMKTKVEIIEFPPKILDHVLYYMPMVVLVFMIAVLFIVIKWSL